MNKHVIARREARICMSRVAKEGEVFYHSLEKDPGGKDCPHCQKWAQETREKELTRQAAVK